MRRGFKTWCERTAEDHRRSVGLALDKPLDPEQLAEHLGVTVWRPEDVPGLSQASLSQLVERDSDNWSAVTLQVGPSRLTIVNSAHSPTRQRSSIAHELAHLILAHKPSRIDVSEDGYLVLSSFEGDEEKEADWLGGALLVPREGLRRQYRRTQDHQRLAEHFSVSSQLLEWRLRMTGVAVQARRANAYRSRSVVGRAGRRTGS